VDTIAVLSFSPELTEQLKELYMSTRKEIRMILAEKSFSLPQYQNLEWRLDVQLGSRSVRNQNEPLFLLKLDTHSTALNQETSQPEIQQHFLQTDYINLKHLTYELEAALQEMKSGHCRRIIRNIK